MRTHQLKSWPRYFRDIVSGKKKFEVRLDDRHYAVGDVLILREWDPAKKVHTGRMYPVRVTYLHDLKVLGRPDLVAMGVGPV
jgi:ASC-1-like (ASCH) protein